MFLNICARDRVSVIGMEMEIGMEIVMSSNRPRSLNEREVSMLDLVCEGKRGSDNPFRYS